MPKHSSTGPFYPKSLLRTGLYTDNRGRSVVYVIDSYNVFNDAMVEYDNVRTGLGYRIPLATFQKRFPNRVDKIKVEFSEQI